MTAGRRPDIPDKPDAASVRSAAEFVNLQQNIRQLVRNFIADLPVLDDAYRGRVDRAPPVVHNQDSR
jgi:hypothetical protein